MCPVSGVDLQVTDASSRVTFEGQSYVVCCPGCAEVFEKDPKAFLEPTCRPVGGAR